METNKFGLSLKNYNLIINCLKSFPEIEKAVIFGSRAMGNYKPGSDIDIALFGQISQQLLAKIKGQLEDELSTPYLFDVVIYNQIDSNNLLQHINQNGVVLY